MPKYKANHHFNKSSNLSSINRSVITRTIHSGGINEIHNIDPLIAACRIASSRRQRDVVRYGYHSAQIKPYHEYLREQGVDTRRIRSKLILTQATRIASGSRARDHFKKPYSYYITKELGYDPFAWIF